MTIRIELLDILIRKALENHIRSRFVPELTKNNSGGSFTSFTCNGITISSAGLASRIEIRLTETSELFSIDCTEVKTSKETLFFRDLFLDSKDFHIKLWNEDQNSRAKSILGKLC